MTAGGPRWVDVGPAVDITRKRKVVVETDAGAVLVIAHDGSFHAFENLCVHRQRELSRGVVLNGRLICPGHQWAFDLSTGWESIKQECQPTFAVRVEDGLVQVDLASRTTIAAAPAPAAPAAPAAVAGDD